MKIKKCGVFIAFLLVFCFSFSVSAEAETDVLLGKKPYLDFEFSRVPNEPSSMNITDADKMSDYDLRSDTFYYDLGRNYSISKVLLEARTSTGNPNALVLNLYDANKNRIYSSGQKEFIFPYNGYNNAPFLPMEKKYDYNNVRYVTVGGSVRVRYVKLFGESYIPSVSGIKGVSDINDISFSWSNPSDDSYRGVKIFKDNSLIVTLGSSDSSYKVQELEADKSYKFRFISLYEENGQIKESKAIEKEEKTLVDPKKIPPSSVTDLKANSTDKSVKLTWKNPKDKVLKGVTLFQDNKKIAETDVKEVFEVDNLKPKTEYGFGVVVVDENGNSSKLTSVKATTLAPVLNPPEGVQATVQNGGLIIAWDRINSQFLKGYNVYVDGKKVNDTLLTSNRLNLKGLENDKSYKIQVSAINVDDVEGKKSEVVTESPSEKAITIDYDEVKIPFSPLDLLTSSISLLALLGGFVLLSIAIIWFKPLKELIVKAARRERDKK